MLDKMRARNHIYYLILNASQTKNDAKEKERWRTRHIECGFQSVAHLLRTFFFVFFFLLYCLWVIGLNRFWFTLSLSVCFLYFVIRQLCPSRYALSLFLILNERKMFAHNFICSIQWKYFWAIKKKRNPS